MNWLAPHMYTLVFPCLLKVQPSPVTNQNNDTPIPLTSSLSAHMCMPLVTILDIRIGHHILAFDNLIPWNIATSTTPFLSNTYTPCTLLVPGILPHLQQHHHPPPPLLSCTCALPVHLCCGTTSSLLHSSHCSVPSCSHTLYCTLVTFLVPPSPSWTSTSLCLGGSHPKRHILGSLWSCIRTRCPSHSR